VVINFVFPLNISIVEFLLFDLPYLIVIFICLLVEVGFVSQVGVVLILIEVSILLVYLVLLLI